MTALQTSRQHHVLTVIICMGIVSLALLSLRKIEM